MNCSSCQQKLESYINGTLSEDMQQNLRIHLEECEKCHEVYSGMVILNRAIQQERSVTSNPFLATRIMEQINQPEETLVHKSFGWSRVLQPVLLTASVALALFMGIAAGNLYSSTKVQNSVPEELMLMDDASIESLNLIITE